MLRTAPCITQYDDSHDPVLGPKQSARNNCRKGRKKTKINNFIKRLRDATTDKQIQSLINDFKSKYENHSAASQAYHMKFNTIIKAQSKRITAGSLIKEPGIKKSH